MRFVLLFCSYNVMYIFVPYQACLRNEPDRVAAATSSRSIVCKHAISIILIYEANMKASIDSTKIHCFPPVEWKFQGQ